MTAHSSGPDDAPDATDPLPIRIVLADDDPLVRSALGLMLGGRSEIEIVAEAGDGEEALAAIAEHSPDVVLMDIRMPRVDGLEATRRLHAAASPPRVIILTTFGLEEYIVAALEAGADGFLLKDTPPADILTAVKAVASGDPMLSPAVTRSLIDRLRNTPEARTAAGERRERAEQRLAQLTDREREVAEAVGRGLSNAEIGRELYLSVPTVKAHVSKLFEKLQTTNRVQIAICVHDAGQW